MGDARWNGGFHPSLCLFGYATLYRICPCAAGDAPRTVCRQTCTHSRFELVPITRLAAKVATVGPIVDPSMAVAQKSSKSANVRCTSIFRVSTLSSPASVHKF
jgi:hypothetical protein